MHEIEEPIPSRSARDVTRVESYGWVTAELWIHLLRAFLLLVWVKERKSFKGTYRDRNDTLLEANLALKQTHWSRTWALTLWKLTRRCTTGNVSWYRSQAAARVRAVVFVRIPSPYLWNIAYISSPNKTCKQVKDGEIHPFVHNRTKNRQGPCSRLMLRPSCKNCDLKSGQKRRAELASCEKNVS